MQYFSSESADAVVLSPAEPVTASVIWLHGLGADGFDFAPIVPELRLPDSMPVRFVFPHAQPRPVTINNGFVMRAWYDILGLGPGRQEDEAGIRESGRAVAAYVDKEIAAGIPASRVVVAGFSQGGAIALQVGLRYPKRLAGIMALSTYLPLHDSLPKEASAANKDVPILMCHGLRDGIVPAELGRQSRDALQALGYQVEWQSYPMEHQVCMEEVVDISGWLQRVLAGNSGNPAKL
jgi:phospholipase/carboxylesterase